jgi:hypothetical protein
MKNIFDKATAYNNARIYDGTSYVTMKDSMKAFYSNSQLVIPNKQLVQDMIMASKDNQKIQINDAGVTTTGAYLEYQLTYVVPQVLQVVYPDQPALELFSVSNEGTLEKVILTRMKAFQGKHTREFENKTKNKGVITVSYASNGIRVEDFGATSSYKDKDLMRAAQLGDPLDASLIQGHDISYKAWINEIAFTGIQDEKGFSLIEGLLNNSQVNSSVVKNATYAFNSASVTGFYMYTDIKNLWNAMCAIAGGNPALFPDTIVCSPRVLAAMQSTTYGTSTVGSVGSVENITTVLEMVKRLLGITEIRSCLQASNLDGSGTTDRLCMFKRGPEAMKLHIPKPLTFSEVFKRGFAYEIESEFFVAGMNIYRDINFGYLKGC